ncbi:MAG: NUMOD4 domain-containing protein [Sphingobacteriales bacterium]
MDKNKAGLDIHNVYTNKSLIDLPGEVWKDVPGFEGSYQASTLGRVKSLDRTIPHPRLYSQFVKGRILCQSVHNNRNIVTGEPMVDLRVTLTVENHAYYFNTRRLIYLTFTDPHLDYKKSGKYVINIDNNGYNNRPENLKLVTKSEKQQRASKRGRLFPHLKTADRSGWKKNYSNSKPVGQYDMEGNLIKRYPSVREASRQLQLDDKTIIQVAKGLYKQWNGFVWKYLQDAD